LTPFQQFNGDITIAGVTITRTGDSAAGNFSDEGFAAGQLSRPWKCRPDDTDYTIASVALDGLSLTRTSAPTAVISPEQSSPARY